MLKNRFPPEFPRAVEGTVRTTYQFVSGEQQKGRRQKAESRKQKAESRKQKASPFIRSSSERAEHCFKIQFTIHNFAASARMALLSNLGFSE